MNYRRNLDRPSGLIKLILPAYDAELYKMMREEFTEKELVESPASTFEDLWDRMKKVYLSDEYDVIGKIQRCYGSPFSYGDLMVEACRQIVAEIYRRDEVAILEEAERVCRRKTRGDIGDHYNHSDIRASAIWKVRDGWRVQEDIEKQASFHRRASEPTREKVYQLSQKYDMASYVGD